MIDLEVNSVMFFFLPLLGKAVLLWFFIFPLSLVWNQAIYFSGTNMKCCWSATATAFESNTSWNDSLMKWTMMDATYIFNIFNSPRKASSHWVPWNNMAPVHPESTRSPPLLHLVPSHKKKAIVREIHTTFIVDQCRHGFQQFRVGRQHGNLLMGTSI